MGKDLADKGKSVSESAGKPFIPWTGPSGDGPNGGVTQGLIGKFIFCRDRFRVRVFEGWETRAGFSAPIEYGCYWHAAEEAYKTDPKKPHKWLEAILAYRDVLLNKYPMDRPAVNHWFSICSAQVPVYVDHWAKHPEEVTRVRLMPEQCFDVPYTLPYSKRTIRLRGRWDSIDLVSALTKLAKHTPADAGIWLQENKTKSQINHAELQQQLKFDLQTMLYIIALRIAWEDQEWCNGLLGRSPVRGVRYNVIRRSSHKSPESMLQKIREDQAAMRAGEWFGRWNVPISDEDVRVFKKECLDPILEQMCLWWSVQTGTLSDTYSQEQLVSIVQQCSTWRTPYGLWNPLEYGGQDVVDEFLRSGSTAGLQRVTKLFPELETSDGPPKTG
jgi:hypothetical protein